MFEFGGLQLTKDEKILAGRVSDMLNSHRGGFTQFLTEREQAIAKLVTVNSDNAVYYGGYSGAERVMLGVFCGGTPKGSSAFPIYPITITWHKVATITHRDILGSLMGLHISRDCIGDILVGDCCGFVFLNYAAHELALSELTKVSSAGVRCSFGANLCELPEQRFKIAVDTVSSMRLDSVVAAAAKKSRSAAAELICAGIVSVNAMPIENVSHRIQSGDKISVRGHGKVQVFEKGSTKKGRISIEIRKYL